MNAALILSGGAGRRFGADMPKQYFPLRGKMVIEYVLNAAREARSIDRIVVAAHDCAEIAELRGKYGFLLASAGDSRNETLKCGLDALSRLGCYNVIVLDSVRPLVTGALIDGYISLLAEYDAVATAQRITDSLGCYDIRKVDRERYYLLQSPEAFRFDMLNKAFDRRSALTEVTQQLPEDSCVKLWFDFPNNPKITYRWDIVSAASMLEDL